MNYFSNTLESKSYCTELFDFNRIVQKNIQKCDRVLLWRHLTKVRILKLKSDHFTVVILKFKNGKNNAFTKPKCVDS